MKARIILALCTLVLCAASAFFVFYAYRSTGIGGAVVEPPPPVAERPAQPVENPLETALGQDLEALSTRVLLEVTQTGASIESVDALEELQGWADALAQHYPGDTGRYLQGWAEVYALLLGALQEETGFWEQEEALTGLIENLQALEPEAEQPLPGLPQGLEQDIRFALTSCYMRGLREKEARDGIISITFGGDTTFGQYPEVPEDVSFHTEFGNRDQDLAFPLRITAPFFQNDSFSVLNCEGTFTQSEDLAQKRFRFKGPPEYVAMFVNGGVEVVNLANNHTYDYKEAGYADTKENLAAHGVEYYGDQEYLVYTVEGVTFGFFGYDLCNQEPDDMRERLERDIAAVRELGAQVVIPTLHWGYEYYNDANSFQVTTGRLAVDLGADMVVGHHPHVLQGVEIYNGKPIVYSLGNFAFGGEELLIDNGDTMLFRQTFRKTDEGAEPGDFQIIPANTSTVTDRSNYVPRPLFGDEADRVARRLLEFSGRMTYGIESLNYLGWEISPDDSIDRDME